MLRTKHSKKQPEMIQVWIPKKRMRRPFPLLWALLALGLFGVFAVVTQVQFNRISNQKLDAARLTSFRSEERAYDVSVKANSDCLLAIETRETYRAIFNGVSLLFSQVAALPALLVPDNPGATEYQAQLLSDIDKLITTPVSERLPPRKVEDCPQIQVEAPESP